MCSADYKICQGPCAVENCATCTADKKTCDDCIPGYFQNEDKNVDIKCYALSNIPANYGIHPTRAGRFKNCRLTTCQDCKENFNNCAEFSSGKKFDQQLKDNWGPYAGTGRVLQWILKLINFGFKIALMPLDFFLSNVIDQYTSFFGYLKLLDGPYLEYPMIVIHYFSSFEYFGFNIPNPHISWALNKKCKVESGLTQRGIDCNIFANYGQNINILWTALGISALVFVICLPLKRREDKLGYYARIIDWNFGWRYFFLFMDGVLLEVFALCLINFSKVKEKTADIDGGFGLSFLIFVFYIAFYVLTACGTVIWLKTRASQSESAVSNKPGMGLHILSLFTFIIRDYKEKQKSDYFYFIPVIYGAKRMILAILAVALVGQGYGQLAPIVVIEVLYTILLIIGKPKIFFIWNLYDIIFSATGALFIFAKMGSLNENLSLDERQQQAGRAMASFLIILALLTTIYILFRIVVAAYQIKKGIASVVTKNMTSSNKQSTVMPSHGPISSDNTKVIEKTKRDYNTGYDIGEDMNKIVPLQKEELSQDSRPMT